MPASMIIPIIIFGGFILLAIAITNVALKNLSPPKK
jgi:hypothetical protein